MGAPVLWYKAWLETRSRFLIALVGMTLICAYAVFEGDRTAYSYTGTNWSNSVWHSTHSLLVLMWVLAITLLSMGGLLREKASGASAFTLALPVPRMQLIGIRIGMCLAQAVTLAIVPWTAMYAVDAIFGRTHSLPQAVFRVVLLLGGGAIFLALAILVSSLVEGEYTAPVVCFGVVVLISIALADPPLRVYNPWSFMTGSEYLKKPSMLLVAVGSVRKRDLT